MCMDKNGLTHARTCVYNVNYHMVWSVKYRRAVLKGGIDESLKDMFSQIAADKGFIIHTTVYRTSENQRVIWIEAGSQQSAAACH